MSLSALGLSEAAAEIREGRVDLGRTRDGVSRPHRRGRARRAGLRVSRPRSCAEAGQGARRASRARPADRAAARRAGRHQGRVRHRRLSDRVRLADLGGPHAARGRRGGGAAARRRRGDHGQDRHRRIRLFPSRQDPQPARQDAHAGRLVDGLGGGGRGLHGAGRDRHADQRLDHPARRVLRRGRLQADPRAHPAHRRAAAVPRARPCRGVRALGRGRRVCWPS